MTADGQHVRRDFVNKKIIEGLKELYAAPKPQRKDAFLRKLAAKESWRNSNGITDSLSYGKFLTGQLKYMRKYNFLISLVLFGIALAGTGSMNRDILWVLSAFVPFLALSAVLEGRKSTRFGMEELELASKFSMKSVLMARLMILGISDALLLGVVLPVMLMSGKKEVLYTGVYILLPYLMAAFWGLYLTRKVRGGEEETLCFLAAALVSLGFLVMRILDVRFFEAAYYWNWAAAVVVLTALTGRECMRLLKETEEYSWNL